MTIYPSEYFTGPQARESLQGLELHPRREAPPVPPVSAADRLPLLAGVHGTCVACPRRLTPYEVSVRYARCWRCRAEGGL